MLAHLVFFVCEIHSSELGSILNKKPNFIEVRYLLVGMRGFEPPISGPPDQHFNQTKLHPENNTIWTLKYSMSTRLFFLFLDWKNFYNLGCASVFELWKRRKQFRIFCSILKCIWYNGRKYIVLSTNEQKRLLEKWTGRCRYQTQLFVRILIYWMTN